MAGRLTTGAIREQKKLFLDGLCNEGLVLVYDLETTGLSPTKDRILQVAVRACQVSELGVCEIDFKNWYINPEMPIPSGATACNGITDEFIADKPTENEVFDEIYEYFGKYAVIGYNNHYFDDKLMQAMYKRHGVDFTPKATYDLYPACVALIPAGETKNCKLPTVTEYFGYAEEINRFHDAGGDTLATELVMASVIKGLETTNPESAEGKIKVEITSVNYWESFNGKTRPRIYANAKQGDKKVSFFIDPASGRYDVKNPEIPIDAYDIDDIERQVMERIKCPYTEFKGKA